MLLMEDLFFFAAAWCLAGFVNNIVGLGAAMVAMPIVVHFMPLSLAVPSSTLIVLVLNIQLAWNYRQNIRWDHLRYILFGGIAGSAAGIYLISSLPSSVLKLAMGIFLVVFAFYALFFEKKMPSHIDSRWGILAGLFSTFFGTAFGLNGPPLAVYTAMSGWKADAAKGFLGACFIISGIAIVSGQVIAGLQSMQTVSYFAAGSPASLLGGWVGIKFSKGLIRKSNRKILLIVILFAGISVLKSCL